MREGLYEVPERFAVRNFGRCDLPVVEFGGSVGVVVCLLNRRLRNLGNHVVVEADPGWAPLLTENRGQNRCRFEISHGTAGVSGSSARIYLSGCTVLASLNLITDRFVGCAGSVAGQGRRLRHFSLDWTHAPI
jgi:hypothetical protein